MRPHALVPSRRDDPLLERLSRDLLRTQKLTDTRRIEGAMTKDLAVFFRVQGEEFGRELEGMRSHFTEAPGEDSWGPAWDRVSRRNADALAAIETKHVEAAIAKGATRLTDDLDLGISFDLQNPRAIEWVAEHSATMVSNVDDTTKAYIRTVLERATTEGWSYDTTAKTLTERFSDFAVGQPQAHIDSRAHLIAVTETAYGYEQGNAMMASDLAAGGIPMEKAWLTVGDENVDEDVCGPNEDEGWIPLEADFGSGDSEPPAHPACRCTTQYQVAGLEADMATGAA